MGCGHDQLRYMRSLDDIKNWLSLDKFGTCETAGAPFWRLLLKYAPDIRVVTIRRPVNEVIGSLARIGVENLYEIRKGLIKLNHKLDQVEARMPNVRSYEYADLEDEVTCGELFEFCIPDYGHDREWWEKWNATNVQTNFPALTRYVGANMKAINKLAGQAAQARIVAPSPSKRNPVMCGREIVRIYFASIAQMLRSIPTIGSARIGICSANFTVSASCKFWWLVPTVNRLDI